MPNYAHQHWKEVSSTELGEWLREHPGLQVKPPMTTNNVNFREWCDPSLGAWPNNVVAKMTRRPRGKGACYQIRVFPE
jgi:hypothetical protein